MGRERQNDWLMQQLNKQLNSKIIKNQFYKFNCLEQQDEEAATECSSYPSFLQDAFFSLMAFTSVFQLLVLGIILFTKTACSPGRNLLPWVMQICVLKVAAKSLIFPASASNPFAVYFLSTPFIKRVVFKHPACIHYWDSALLGMHPLIIEMVLQMSLIFTAIIFYSGIALSDLNKISGKLAWMIHNSAVSTLSSSPLWVIPRNHEYFVKEIMLSFSIQKINILFYPTPEWHSSQSPRSEPCSDTVISLFFCSWNAVIWIYFRSTCQLSFAQPYRQNSWSPEYANLVYWNCALRIPCRLVQGWIHLLFLDGYLLFTIC